jgi:DNA-binding transcriptional LysR family regulator
MTSLSLAATRTGIKSRLCPYKCDWYTTQVLSARMPELTALEALVAVARTGSLNTAAVELGRSQQAVSSRIAALEAQTGVALVRRTTRGSALTPAGVVVVEWAATLLDQAARLDAGLATLRHDRQVQLRVGASQTIAERLLPRWLVELNAETATSAEVGAGDQGATGAGGAAGRTGVGGAQAELRVGNSGAVADWVRTGAVEVGFVEGPRAPRECRSRVIAQDELVLVVAARHRWASRHTPVTAAELAATPLVTREAGSGTRLALELALAAALATTRRSDSLATPAAAVEPVDPVAELSTTAAVRTAVLAGAGPAVLSALVVAEDVAVGRLRAVPLAGLDLRRSLRAIWLGGRTPPAGAARRLVAIAAHPSAG